MAFLPSRMQAYLLLLSAVLVIGTVSMMAGEGLAPFDAFYFIVVTIATVGYGDITPSSMYGKALAIILIIAGVGTFVAVIADLVETFLSREERRARKRKINMIIGLFFSEIGTDLLRQLSSCDPCTTDIRGALRITAGWTSADFARLRRVLAGRQYCITVRSADLPDLKRVLSEKRAFFLSLLENPVIFEHDSFTETLQAFFHLTEELMHRRDVSSLPAPDIAHLVHDINRGYTLLIHEWVMYMEHLHENYPYLFSLAIRTNPFDPDATVAITGLES
jgi:hypothetical protein